MSTFLGGHVLHRIYGGYTLLSIWLYIEEIKNTSIALYRNLNIFRPYLPLPLAHPVSCPLLGDTLHESEVVPIT